MAQLGTLVRVAWGLLREDPTHFSVQVARRLPARVRRTLGRMEPSGALPAGLRALVFTMADRRGEAVDLLTHASSGRIVNQLRVLHGVALPASATKSQKARQLWEVGDLHGALEAAPRGSALHRTLAAYERTLRPHRRLRIRDLPVVPAPERVSAGPIRVMHQLTNSLPWTQSGYTLRSHRVLTALTETGVQARAITRIGYPLDIGGIGSPETDVVDGIAYHRFIPRRMPTLLDERYAAQAAALARRAQDFGAHILHTTTPYTNALITEAAANALEIPWVYEARGEMESTWLASRPDWAQQAAAESDRYHLMRAKEVEMAIRADAVVVLSRVQRDGLIARGVPREKVTVIPNAADLSHMKRTHTPEQAREQLGLSPGRWIGTVSAIVDYEGLGTIIEAVALLKAAGVHVNAAIVGDGVALPDLRDQARALGVEDQVVFPGRVDPATATLWYQALDLMTIPRLDTPVTRAVTPMKGLQAMAYGIPQIVSDLPALAEIATAQGQGVTVSAGIPAAWAAEISELFSDEARYMALSEAALAATVDHTWANRAHQYSELYAQVSQER